MDKDEVIERAESRGFKFAIAAVELLGRRLASDRRGLRKCAPMIAKAFALVKTGAGIVTCLECDGTGCAQCEQIGVRHA